MAKRYSDTDKWKKPFLRSLEAPYKLLWFYILDDCDHAGIWQVDREVAELRIGERIDWNLIPRIFEGKIQIFDNGEKWHIPDFLSFQYGPLNPKNRVHESVLSLLNKYNLLEKNKELISPLQGAKDKDKDKDKDMEIEGVVGETEIDPPEPPIKIPLDLGIDEEEYDCQLSYMITHSFFTIIQMHRGKTKEELIPMHRIFFEQKAPVGELKGKTEMEIMKFFYNWIPKHIKQETENTPKYETRKRNQTYQSTNTVQPAKAFGKL